MLHFLIILLPLMLTGSAAECTDYFISVERNYKPLHSKNDVEQSSIYVGDYYVIIIKDNKTFIYSNIKTTQN